MIGSRQWPCDDDHGVTGFDLPEGQALLTREAGVRRRSRREQRRHIHRARARATYRDRGQYHQPWAASSCCSKCPHAISSPASASRFARGHTSLARSLPYSDRSEEILGPRRPYVVHHTTRGSNQMKNLVLGSLIALQRARRLVASSPAATTPVETPTYRHLEAQERQPRTPRGVPAGFRHRRPVQPGGRWQRQPDRHAASRQQRATCFVDLFDCARPRRPQLPAAAHALQDVDRDQRPTPTAHVYAESVPAYVDMTNSRPERSARRSSTTAATSTSTGTSSARRRQQPLTCCGRRRAASSSIGTDVVEREQLERATCSTARTVRAYTAGYVAATYTVSVAALNSADQSIGTAPTLTNKRDRGPEPVTDLGTVTIPIIGK